MSEIITLTMNPAIDTSTRVDRVAPAQKLRCERPRRDPGGGGINVARVVNRLGGRAVALFTSGGRFGELLGQLCRREELECEAIPIGGQTRENLVVLETASDQQYRFGMPGPDLTSDEWRRCLDRTAERLQAGTWLVASGSLPPGVPDDFYAQLARRADKAGARMVIDTSGPALYKAVTAGVYLIKPNMRELEHIAGASIGNEHQQEQTARRIVESGGSNIIVVSLGSAGALLVTRDTIRRFRSPNVPINSRVGAGDSMVAGMVVSLARGDSVENAVQMGVAAGAAAVMTPGTELCRREDVENLVKKLQQESPA